MMSLLLLSNFYPAMSYRRVRKKKKATNYCIRFGHSLWSAQPVASVRGFNVEYQTHGRDPYHVDRRLPYAPNLRVCSPRVNDFATRPNVRTILHLSFTRLRARAAFQTWRTIYRRYRKFPRNKVTFLVARGTSRRQTRLILPQLLSSRGVNSPPPLEERQFRTKRRKKKVSTPALSSRQSRFYRSTQSNVSFLK